MALGRELLVQEANMPGNRQAMGSMSRKLALRGLEEAKGS